MLHKDTLVLTPSGFVAISQIQEGDLVLTTRNVDRVIKNESFSNIQLRRLRIEEDIILCSQDHEFWIYNFDDLYLFRVPQNDDKLVQYDPLVMKTVPILDSDLWTKGEVFRLHLEQDHHVIIQGAYISRTF